MWGLAQRGSLIMMVLAASLAAGASRAGAAVNFQRTDYALAATQTAMAVGDLDGRDGPDLVAVSAAAGDLTVLLNNGNGTFGAPQTYALPAGCNAAQVELSDYENTVGQQVPDGNLDALVLCYGSGRLVTLAGNGDGSFGSPQTVPLYLPGYLGGYTSQFAIGAFGYYTRLPSVVYRTSTPTYEEGVFCVLDNFSNPDAACKDPDGSDPGAPLSNGAMIPVDFDGGGQQAVLTTGGTQGVVIWEQAPGPPLQWSADEVPFGQYAAGVSYGGMVTAGDLNGDGRQDIVTSSSTSFGGVINTIMWNGTTWASPRSFPSVAGVSAIVTGDFDGDGHTDVMAATGYGQAVVLAGDGSGNLGAPQSIPLIGSGNPAYASVVQADEADIDRNGTPDVVLLDDSAGTFEVLRNLNPGTGTGTAPAPAPVPPAPAPGSAGPLVPPLPVTYRGALSGITQFHARVRLERHFVVTLGRAADPPTSSVTLTLTVAAPKRGKHTARADARRPRRLVLGRTTIRIPRGARRSLRLALNRAGRGLLARHSRVTARLTLLAIGPGGSRQTRRRTLTITHRT